jgi:hypothetical protein
MLYRQPEWRRRTIKKQQKFSLQANRKIREGDSHPDRDAQFASINVAVGAPSRGQAVISVNTKKKAAIKSNALNFTANGTTRFAHQRFDILSFDNKHILPAIFIASKTPCTRQKL